MDYNEAIRWWRMAANSGFAGAQYDLGFSYRDGLGVAQDAQAEVKWIRLAAEQGFAIGQFALKLIR